MFGLNERICVDLEKLRMREPLVGLIMGSQSDWDVMKSAAEILQEFEIPHESKVVSAHRTPLDMVDYAQNASLRGIRLIIAGAGGAAHLPGMVASLTTIPVLGVPVPSQHMGGLDSLYSIVQMPRGIPVATFAIGKSGAANAALFAVSMLAESDKALSVRLQKYREALVDQVHRMTLPPS